ncbi:hypothetical protein [Bradyrhizobium liaoningense]
MFRLHPDAAAAIDAIASVISVSNQSPQSRRSDQPTWGDRHIDAEFTDKDIIGASQMFEHDGLGEKISFFSYRGDTPLAILGEDFAQLKKLVQRTLGIAALKSSVSSDYVESLAIDWCLDFKGAKPFSEYLTERVRTDISDHQIWVPVSDLQVQDNFQFGLARIITIGRDFLEDAERLLAIERPEHQAHIEEFFKKLRHDLLGNAAVAVSIRGEDKFASKQAQIVAEAAIGLLRFFHPAGMTSKVHCPLALLGAESVPKTSSLLITGINRFNYSKGLKYPRAAAPWRLSRAELTGIKQHLEVAGQLIGDDGNSEFAERVRSSILTYSKGMTFPDISDRLVYSFSALEGLFLKDGSEPILQNVAERVAFAIAKDPDERIDIVKTFRTVYAARSQYVHHRQNKSLPDGSLDKFFVAAWCGLATALRNIRNYNSTSAFLEVIERMKFS